MIAAELARRYTQGEAAQDLARAYGMSWQNVVWIVKRMGVATGTPRCKRCEILLSQAPRGGAGFCGWCTTEVP